MMILKQFDEEMSRSGMRQCVRILIVEQLRGEDIEDD